MKRVIVCLMLSAFAMPAHAGHGSIEETDDAFIVEYSGDAADKTPEKPSPKPAAAPAWVPPARPTPNPVPPESPIGSAAPAPETSPVAERPSRIRDQVRRDRAQRGTQPPGASGGE
jgi:hypothetical protein